MQRCQLGKWAISLFLFHDATYGGIHQLPLLFRQHSTSEFLICEQVDSCCFVSRSDAGMNYKYL